MPRHARLVMPNIPLHIIQRGADRQRCFWRDADYLRYLDALRGQPAICAVHAYVLMSNHIHLLVSVTDERAPGGLMKALDQHYTQYVNWRYRRSGPLWEGRYKSCLLQDERYFLVCQRYIELNPVRAGLSDYPGQYRWSSYRGNAEGKADDILTPHALYLSLGQEAVVRRQAYRDLFLDSLEPGRIDNIRRATNADFAVGDQAFLRGLVHKRGGG